MKKKEQRKFLDIIYFLRRKIASNVGFGGEANIYFESSVDTFAH